MNEFITSLNSFSTQVLLLVTVIIIKVILAKFVDIKPLFFFSLYCNKLAHKVNKPQHSTKQKQLSGLIALAITFIPLAIILWLFADFIMVPWLWHALLLFLAIGEFNLSTTSKEIAQALTANQKHFVREKLSSFVLREVDKLSTMGLCKATIEMQLLRYAQHYFVISFYFIFVSPLAALLVRLLIEMHYCWNRKQPSYIAFGHTIALITALIQWLPIRLLAFVLIISNIGHNFTASVFAFARHFFQLNNDILLAIFALSLHRQLSGVAIYEQQKLRKAKFNSQAATPTISDIITTTKIIQQISLFSLALLSIIAISISVLSPVIRN
jgi:adenosylcobinamide-phosphate synthase